MWILEKTCAHRKKQCISKVCVIFETFLGKESILVFFRMEVSNPASFFYILNVERQKFGFRYYSTFVSFWFSERRNLEYNWAWTGYKITYGIFLSPFRAFLSPRTLESLVRKAEKEETRIFLWPWCKCHVLKKLHHENCFPLQYL